MLFGAVAASAGTIFAKFGLKGVDSNLLTTLRGIDGNTCCGVITSIFTKFSFSSLQSSLVKLDFRFTWGSRSSFMAILLLCSLTWKVVRVMPFIITRMLASGLARLWKVFIPLGKQPAFRKYKFKVKHGADEPMPLKDEKIVFSFRTSKQSQFMLIKVVWPKMGMKKIKLASWKSDSRLWFAAVKKSKPWSIMPSDKICILATARRH